MNIQAAYIAILLFSSIIFHGYSSNTPNDFETTKNAIIILQTCKNKKTTSVHSNDISLLLNTIFFSKTIQSFLKSNEGKLYHIILMAEIERMKNNEWFGFPIMQNNLQKSQNDDFMLMAAIDPNMALFPREGIIREVDNLQNNRTQFDTYSLISELLDFYKVFDPDLYVNVMELEDHKLILSLEKLKNNNLNSLGISPISATTIQNLVDEINKKYSLCKDIMNKFNKIKK